jgi:galactokinase/mevalonate kinase-like predicted kinase
LEPGVCLDFAAVDDDGFCVRVYGMDDAFSGALADRSTHWLGRSVSDWFKTRRISWEEAGLNPETDIYQSRLFPILKQSEIRPRFLEWLFMAEPPEDPDFAHRWRTLPRLSAEEINLRADLGRIEHQRAIHRRRALLKMYKNRRISVFFRTDLDETARLFAAGSDPLPPSGGHACDPLESIHDHMWRSAVLRYRNEPGAEEEERRAFACLREAILGAVRSEMPRPKCNVLADQIVWGRAPARLDFAGGWTDTPPYCLQHGGQVVNAAVDLNGQPPIQIFAKLSPHHEIVLRSIDLGIEQRITSHDQLASYDRQGGAFTLAKAALTLAGFLPGFYDSASPFTLAQQLKAFGGGIELSLVAAIPQGSGLGTSSILAATLLGTLNALCGLNWDTQKIMTNTLAIEQMLTTGGGWQDQAGGILRGVKYCKTLPGILQNVTTRWLPDHLLSESSAHRTMLLYYTGITRLAKNVLQEIVRGMFLNSADRLSILKDIGENADFVADAIGRNDLSAFCEGVRRSWDLNQRLDAGTNPPAIQAILGPIMDYLAAVKLLGAGGGGYMILMAKDDQAALRIRRLLETSPPNVKARFVDLSVSRVGMEITRS